MKKWCKHIKYVVMLPLYEREYLYTDNHNGECYVCGWRNCPECGAPRPKAANPAPSNTPINPQAGAVGKRDELVR